MLRPAANERFAEPMRTLVSVLAPNHLMYP